MIFPSKYQYNKDSYIQKYKDKYTHLSSCICPNDIQAYIDANIYYRWHRPLHNDLIENINDMIHRKDGMNDILPEHQKSTVISIVIAIIKFDKEMKAIIRARNRIREARIDIYKYDYESDY